MPRDPLPPDPSSGEPATGGPGRDVLQGAYSALFDALPDPMLLVDLPGSVIACNVTAERWLARPRDRIIGQPILLLFDEDCRAELHQLLSAGWSWAAERRFTLSDGRVVGLNASPWDELGERCFVVSVHDLTTRRVLDEAADQQRRMEALADLAGAIARELNDPMSIVQGRLELLLELGVQDPDAVRRHLEVALEHCRRVSATLRNLRLVGRTAEPRNEPVAIERAVTEALELVGPRGRSVIVDIRPPDLSTSGEAAMYARVFANLLRRALDQASRTGQVELRAQVDRQGVLVRIATRGRLRIQDKMQPTESGGGTFSIDETLLASAGGHLRVEEAPHESAFSVFLPAAPHRRSRAKPIEDHLLVVGSEELERGVRALLGREGFALTVVRDGPSAVALCATGEPVDVVLTELLLDGMSGLGLAEALLRTRPELAGKIVLVTPTRIENIPSSLVPLEPPLRRRPLLEALGRRIR